MSWAFMTRKSSVKQQQQASVIALGLCVKTLATIVPIPAFVLGQQPPQKGSERLFKYHCTCDLFCNGQYGFRIRRARPGIYVPDHLHLIFNLLCCSDVYSSPQGLLRPTVLCSLVDMINSFLRDSAVDHCIEPSQYTGRS